ncbi:lycopene cyclase domain-containing protein [Rubrivirga sp.]|uniref:lycopene cyclase domain-containing protein n=1 Tax=Rubrivirga sp. TaxID=1885344 RepID=UPI003C724C1C
MTYLEFHLAFTVPPLVVLALLQGRTRAPWWPLGLLIGIAFVYTTPWDNYLVAREIWTYPPGRVLATIGFVPVEEYAFFGIQTIIAGLWLRLFQARWDRVPEPSGRGVRWPGIALFGAITVAGVAMLLAAGHWLYLGLILAWAGPPLLLQWAVGGELVWARRRLVAVTVIPISLYLWVADWFAITQAGIWNITDATRTGWEIVGLPVEEALFFVVTTLLVAQGLVMLERPISDMFSRKRVVG